MERFEGKNSGALKSLSLIGLKDLVVPSGNVISYDTISVALGKSWSVIPFTHETAGYREQRKMSKAGDYFEKEIGFSIPSVRNEVSAAMEVFSGRTLAALVTDMNSVSRLVFPLRMEYAASVPAQPAGFNGYTFTLKGSHAHASPFVVMPLPG